MQTYLILFGTFALACVSFLLGYSLCKINKKKSPTPTVDEKQRAEKMQKEFNEVMNYNLSKALERRRA